MVYPSQISQPVKLKDELGLKRRGRGKRSLLKRGKRPKQMQEQELGLAIGAALMDLKKATALASVTVMTCMLAGGYFVKVRILTSKWLEAFPLLLYLIWVILILQRIPVFISWLRYFSYNYQTYKLLLKIQYEQNGNWVDVITLEKEMEKVNAIFSCALESINSGESVLIPMDGWSHVAAFGRCITSTRIFKFAGYKNTNNSIW